MTATDDERWCSKRPHYNEIDAERARVVMEEKTGDRFKLYQCKYCNKFHIGRV